MKKIISLLMCLVLLLCVGGCDQKADSDKLLVGYGRASIVPDRAMPLGGYPEPANRIFTNVLDPIYVTAIAFTDASNNTAILLQYDLGRPNNTGIGLALRDAAEQYGIPRINIMVSGTHTHSAPHSSAIPQHEEYYEDLLYNQTLAAIKEAMESRLPAQIYAGAIDTYNLNFIRHYRLEDGTIAGSNFGTQTGVRAVKHMQEVDPQLQILCFKRDGGKNVVMANFQCHPLLTGSGTSYNLSSDFIGPMTTYVEEQLDCHFAYFTGASGNINPTSRISSENIASDHVEHGQALGKYAVLASSNLQRVEGSGVRVVQEIYKAKSSTGASAPLDVKLGAFCVGGVAFVNAPIEMFCSNGKFIKDNSPFELTFVTTLAYNTTSYVPDAQTFAYDVQSYEERECRYAEGTGEGIANTFVEMLNTLHTGQGG